MPEPSTGIRVTHAYVDVPIEVQFVRTGSGCDFVADLPRWRWQTVFDPKRGRLKLNVGQGEGA